MDTYGEIGCLEILSKEVLDVSDAFHEVVALVFIQFSEPLDGPNRDDEGVTCAPWKDVKEGVPSLAA